MYQEFKELVDSVQKVTIIQAENPDADSLGSAIALGEVLRTCNKDVFHHCAVEIPKYLRYIPGWEEVSSEFNSSTELIIIVDASAQSLLEKSLNLFDSSKKQIVVFDHHRTEATLENIELIYNQPEKASTSEVLFECFTELNLTIPKKAATAMLYSILGDTLGLTSVATSTQTVQTFAELVKLHDIKLGDLDEKRRALNKKPFKIFEYKQRLMTQAEFHFNNELATVTIPLEDIKEYSDLYNPSALFMEELRSVEEIRMAIAFKVYEDRVTAKLREIHNAPFCNKLAEAFGGGGHPYAAGFKVYDIELDELKKQVLKKYYELSQDL